MLFLYSRNISEYPESALFIPLVISFAFALIIYVLMQVVFRHIDKAAIVSSLVIFICLSYSRFLEIYKDINIRLGNISITHDVLVFTASIVVIAASIFFIIRYKKSLPKVNQLFLGFVCILLLFPIFKIASFEAKTGRFLRIDLSGGLIRRNITEDTENLPDIYYFIFDRYAGPKSLKEEYSYDNSKFFNFLKDKGFYLAKDATTNYPKTSQSLGSSLNYEYINYLTEKTNGGVSSDQTVVTPLIRNNKVIKFLKSKGYTYIHIGPVWNPTSINPNADKNFIFKDGLYPGADEFTTGFLNTTIAAPLFKDIFRDRTAISEDPYNNDHRKRVLFELESIAKVPKMPGPKFVFMHILIPHDPFVFGKNCEPIAETEVEKHDHVTNYLNQLNCANINIMKMIDDILARSAKPPVIVLQSDEGPFPMKTPLPDKESWGTATDATLREKYPILNAYYMPGVSNKELYQSITPVNSFRVIFNVYFDTKLPLLPDRNYVFQDNQNFYKFTDITERLR